MPYLLILLLVLLTGCGGDSPRSRPPSRRRRPLPPAAGRDRPPSTACGRTRSPGAMPPTSRRLAARGAYTWEARTISPPTPFLPTYRCSRRIPRRCTASCGRYLPFRGRLTFPTLFTGRAGGRPCAASCIVGKNKFRFTSGTPEPWDVYVVANGGDDDVARSRRGERAAVGLQRHVRAPARGGPQRPREQLDVAGLPGTASSTRIRPSAGRWPRCRGGQTVILPRTTAGGSRSTTTGSEAACDMIHPVGREAAPGTLRGYRPEHGRAHDRHQPPPPPTSWAWTCPRCQR